MTITLKELKDLIKTLEEKNYSLKTQIYVWDKYKEESISIDSTEYEFDEDNNEFVYLLI